MSSHGIHAEKYTTSWNTNVRGPAMKKCEKLSSTQDQPEVIFACTSASALVSCATTSPSVMSPMVAVTSPVTLAACTPTAARARTAVTMAKRVEANMVGARAAAGARDLPPRAGAQWSSARAPNDQSVVPACSNESHPSNTSVRS